MKLKWLLAVALLAMGTKCQAQTVYHPYTYDAPQGDGVHFSFKAGQTVEVYFYCGDGEHLETVVNGKPVSGTVTCTYVTAQKGASKTAHLSFTEPIVWTLGDLKITVNPSSFEEVKNGESDWVLRQGWQDSVSITVSQ
jgi:hypothetical protein